MSKKTRLVMMMVSALAALFLLPAVSFASPHTSATPNTTTTGSFAFTGLVNNTTTALTGGLTLSIRDTGFFNGNFHEPDGTQISVSGEVKSDGSFNITFYTKDGVPFIKGVAGASNSKGEYIGTFKLYSDDKVLDGTWSAVPVAESSDVLALAFTGTVTRGPNSGLFLSGAIVLDSSTLKGTFNEPDGTVLSVKAKLLKDSKYAIKVNFADGTIIGYGKWVKNPANPVDKGFSGPFYGPGSNKGYWTAYLFGF